MKAWMTKAKKDAGSVEQAPTMSPGSPLIWGQPSQLSSSQKRWSLEGPSWKILLLLGLGFQTSWTKKWTNLATKCGEILLVHAQKQSEFINTQLAHQQHLFPNSLTQSFESMDWPLLLPQEPNFSFFSNLSLGAIKKNNNNLLCKSPNTFKSRETR